MQIKLHKPDWYFIYPRVTRWHDGKGRWHLQIGWIFNGEIITKGEKRS